MVFRSMLGGFFGVTLALVASLAASKDGEKSSCPLQAAAEVSNADCPSGGCPLSAKTASVSTVSATGEGCCEGSCPASTAMRQVSTEATPASQEGSCGGSCPLTNKTASTGHKTKAALTAHQHEAKSADSHKKLTCPVSGSSVSEEASLAYRGGHIHFCHEGCIAAFKKDTAKFSTKANMQLVASGQARQKACPLSGGKAKAETASDVGGTQVAFCCNNCKGKVAKAEAAQQIEMCFSDAAFEKGFELKQAKKKPSAGKGDT